MFHCKSVLPNGKAVDCPWVIYSASKIESVAITANFSVLNAQSKPNTSSLKVVNVATHVFIGCYSVVRRSLWWRGETGVIPQSSLSHQWLLSLWRDALFKDFCTAHATAPQKCFQSGPTLAWAGLVVTYSETDSVGLQFNDAGQGRANTFCLGATLRKPRLVEGHTFLWE